MPSGVGKRFLDPAAIEAAMTAAAQVARRSNVDIALAGGVAMQVYGSDRFTMEVDFIASGVPDGITVERQLSFGGVSGRTEGGVPICIIVRDDEFAPLYEDALKSAIKTEEDIPIVTAEFLAAMKMVAGRPKDLEDLRKLIALDALELSRARQVIREHLGAYAVKEFNSVVDEVAWMLRRGDAG